MMSTMLSKPRGFDMAISCRFKIAESMGDDEMDELECLIREFIASKHDYITMATSVELKR